MPVELGHVLDPRLEVRLHLDAMYIRQLLILPERINRAILKFIPFQKLVFYMIICFSTLRVVAGILLNL